MSKIKPHAYGLYFLDHSVQTHLSHLACGLANLCRQDVCPHFQRDDSCSDGGLLQRLRDADLCWRQRRVSLMSMAVEMKCWIVWDKVRCRNMFSCCWCSRQRRSAAFLVHQMAPGCKGILSFADYGTVSVTDCFVEAFTAVSMWKSAKSTH